MSAVTIQMNPEQHVAVVEIRGRFDFNLHKEFRAIYKGGMERDMKYLVDMRHVDYIDSSALGMLLLLREQAAAHGATVTIINCGPEIRKVLVIAQFERLNKNKRRRATNKQLRTRPAPWPISGPR